MTSISGRIKTAKPDISVPSFGFVGKMASGKNSYADELKLQIEAEFGIPIYRGSFSTKITEVAEDLFEMGAKDRDLLSKMASSLGKIDPYVWANYLIRQIEQSGSAFIIDGIRFPIEESRFRLKFNDFVLIRIEVDEAHRLEAYKKEYGHYPTRKNLKARGEKALLEVHHDLSIFNDYEKETLVEQVGLIVASIRDGTLHSLLRS